MGRGMGVVTLIDSTGRARDHDIGTRSTPIALDVAGVEYVRVGARGGRIVYREVDTEDDDVMPDTDD